MKDEGLIVGLDICCAESCCILASYNRYEAVRHLFISRPRFSLIAGKWENMRAFCGFDFDVQGSPMLRLNCGR